MVELFPLVSGALGGTAFDLLIDFPLDKAGLLYAWQARDSEQRYIWGIGTGDLLSGAVGAIMTAAGTLLAGKGTAREQAIASAIRDAGLGWLLSLTTTKLAELYGYLTTIWPVTIKPLFGSASSFSSARFPATRATVPKPTLTPARQTTFNSMTKMPHFG
jgi:hypothetical protein